MITLAATESAKAQSPPQQHECPSATAAANALCEQSTVAANIAQSCLGQRPKLTDATQKSILDAMGRGHCVEVAAGLAGVSARTVHNWLARGQSTAVADQSYSLFARAVDLARARFIDDALRQINA